MKDPHIHVEKDVFFPQAMVQKVVSETTGIVVPLPKTITTGCGRRRPFGKTSATPDMVTCLACREYARELFGHAAHMARSVLMMDDVDMTPYTRAVIEREVPYYEGMRRKYS
jgi:hypothetical protein